MGKAVDEMRWVAAAAEEQGDELSELVAEPLHPVCYSDGEGNEIHNYYYHQMLIQNRGKTENGKMENSNIVENTD